MKKINGLLRGYGNIYVNFDLSIKTFGVIFIFVVKFLLTCLVSEVLMHKDISHLPYWIFKIPMT